jgi:hypothetical protein
MLRRLSAGFFATAAFAFVAPLAATAKDYQPSMVDSTAIEARLLIAAAGPKESCIAKGKKWKAKFGSSWSTADCNADRNDTAGSTKYCSCQK